MNAPESSSPAVPPAQLSWKLIVVGCCLFLGYLLLRPWLVSVTGLNLPGFSDLTADQSQVAHNDNARVSDGGAAPVIDEAGQEVADADRDAPETETADSNPKPESPAEPTEPTDDPAPRHAPEGRAPLDTKAGTAARPPTDPDKPEPAPTRPVQPQPNETASSPTKNKSKKDRPQPVLATPPAATAKSPPTTDPSRSSSAPASTAAKSGNNSKNPSDAGSKDADAPPLGQLTEVSRRVFRSTAGLIYKPGSADGHRVDHVLHHAEDDLSKPVHGVFQGTKSEILALIDEAYLVAKKKGPPWVRKQSEGDRTVYFVNMNRKIGYLGGESGERRNHPACKYLRLVLEGDEVITAFPSVSDR